MLSLATSLIKKPLFQSSIRKLNTRLNFTVECEWVSKERRLDWSLLRFLAERLYLPFISRQRSSARTAVTSAGNVAQIGGQLKQAEQTWLAPLGAGSGKRATRWILFTTEHEPPSLFEGARTTEVRLDRRRGCSCAVVASSPTLAFFLSHPSRESAPSLLSAKLYLGPPLSFSISLSFSFNPEFSLNFSNFFILLALVEARPSFIRVSLPST